MHMRACYTYFRSGRLDLKQFLCDTVNGCGGFRSVFATQTDKNIPNHHAKPVAKTVVTSHRNSFR